MEESSILTSIKKLIGPDDLDTSFDVDIIMAINTAFMILNQLGVGPVEGFAIRDKTTVWDAFIGDKKNIEGVKTYVYLKTRLIFDPPQSGFLIEAIKDQIAEITWRLTE